MMLILRILVGTIVLGISAASLSACGQQGPLYLPTEPAAKNRATLPETLWRSRPANASPQAPAPATPTPATSPASEITPVSQ